MLTGPQEERDRLRELLEPHASRVEYHDPVAVTDIASRINEWDVEIIFFPPIRTNLRHALPNKFFEAVQGRLAVVAGESPDLAELIEHYGIGAIVSGWSARDLAATDNALTADDVRTMKAATARAARELTAEREREAFLAAFP
jgi:hypothetical protein